MRKTLVVSCLAALFVLGTLSLALAGGDMKKEGTHHAAAGEMHKVVGEVVSVDADGQTFVVKETLKKGSEVKEMTFVLDPKGKVMVHEGKAAMLADLKSGDMVTVHFHKKGDTMMVHEVVVAKPAVAKPMMK